MGDEQRVAVGVHRVKWWRVILDEAHCTRNLGAQSKACCKLECVHRWCLSGTPIVNKAEDIYALYKFLRYQPFDDKRFFNEKIGRAIRRRHTARDETEMDMEREI